MKTREEICKVLKDSLLFVREGPVDIKPELTIGSDPLIEHDDLDFIQRYVEIQLNVALPDDAFQLTRTFGSLIDIIEQSLSGEIV